VKRLSVLFVTPLTALLALTACGGTASDNGVASVGGAKGSATPSAAGRASMNPQDAKLRYARCLRAHGVNMPDDDKDLPKAGVSIPEAAEKACREWLQGVTVPIDANDPETRDRFLKVARCMRAHGFDWPDPRPGTLGGPPPDYDGGNDKPRFKKTLTGCWPGRR
jgi:hypothetical protein